MCGIFGSVNKNVPLEDVRKFLLHRGPDAQTSWHDELIQLHHFRLSILDLDGGIQPMSRGDLMIIFNGEIYNHLDIRKKFDLLCESYSDTETILAVYEKLGADCLTHFDGMFALAIYNKRKKTLFLARDRAGKKPLYIYRNQNQFLFSSELNALSSVLNLEPDISSIDQFFKGFFVGRATPYKNVVELLGGEYINIDLQNIEDFNPVKWWDINEQYDNKIEFGYEDLKSKTEDHINVAVQRRVESSDLEVGAFLSGGIDSGLVVAAAHKVNPKLKTFTVAMPGAYNEAPLAKLVANRFNTDHTEINIDFKDLNHDFEKIIDNYGEPFIDSSAIPSYYVSKAAKDYVTVVLNGDGADELFGGYRRYVPFAHLDLYKSKYKKIAGLVSKILPPSNEKKSKYNYIQRLLSSMSEEGPDLYYGMTIDIFHNHKEAYVNSGFNHSYISNLLNKYEHWSGLDKQMALDYYIILSGNLLKKMDIATMAHSLEGRSPFLSKELQELAPSISDNFKVKGKRTKVLLRDIAKDWLPNEIFNQPKRGFEIPLKKWINHDLNDFVQSFLNKKNCFVDQFIKKEFRLQLINNNKLVSEEKRAKMLYQLLVTEIWASKRGFN